MRTFLLAGVALLLATSGWSPAADDPAPQPPESAAPGASLNELPWSPDIHHANVWPYDKPLVIETDYCGPPGEFWLRAEYLQWWLKGDHVPPLASAGPTGSEAIPGVLGAGTILGGDTVDRSPYFGGRFIGGVWFESAYVFGFEGSYFFLADQKAKFLAVGTGQPGSPDLGQPFVDARIGQPNALLVASALGSVSGSVRAFSETELQGADGLLVWNFCRQTNYSLNLYAGFRYLDLGGVLNVATASSTLFAGEFPVSTFTTDQFSARNHFYGGEVAGRFDYRWHQLVLSLNEKLALGARTTDIVIAGGTQVVSPNGPLQIESTGPGLPIFNVPGSSIRAGGVLAQPSNIGNHSSDAFAVVNELNLQVGWQFTDCVQAFLGYSFFYFSSVVRAGDLPDFTVNPAQAAGGPVRPVFAAHATDFWAHGFNVGLEIRY
jgi:hypothetical protein